MAIADCNFLLTSQEFILKQQDILDFYKNNVKQHLIETKDNFKLSVLEFNTSNYDNTLVIVPGRGEVEYKYAELLYSLRSLNLRVIIPFVRGQGHSDNVLKKSNATYIEDFKLYRLDLLFCLEKLNVNNFSMLSFSLGALISLDYIKNERLLPSKLCTIAPFLYPYINLSDFIVTSFIKIANIAFKTRYAPHYGEYKRLKFEDNKHSHCIERYEKYHDYYETNWQNCPGGITYAFLKSCLDKQLELLNSKYELNVPLLCIVPLEDKIVNSNKTLKFLQKHSNDKLPPKFITIENAYHDILNEKDEIRNVNLYKALTFLFC